jgi:23S rRNA pseudouridine2605 synthase
MEERLQKVLAQAGVASRREAEEYITAGRVKVNGKVVKELGTKVGPDAFIMVDGHPIRRERKTYLLFYKPRGVVTTMKDPEGRKTIADYVKDIPQRVYPVGRLDYNTEGLLLLTNDGDLAQAMTHPSHEVNKVYEVTVPGIVPQEKLDLLRIGVKLEDGMTAPALVDLTGYDYEKNLTRFNVTIHEGRNRQVRRMCDYIGFPVRYLRRVQMGTLTLDGLRRGDCRELFNEEIESLRLACGLKRDAKPKRIAEAKPEAKPKRRTEEKPISREMKPKRKKKD